MIIPTLWSVSFDPKYWKIPYEFRPERFLDDVGNIIKNDAMLTFSTGKIVLLDTFIAFLRHLISRKK